MENLTQEQQTKVFNFLNSLDTEITVTDYVNIEDIDKDDIYNSIYETIRDNGGFDVEIIYYSNAIEYLKQNDPSLKDSIEIALEYGFELKNITSEALASLLASRNAEENFYKLQDEIENFFSTLTNGN
jgi:hypothetical protein